MNKFRLIYYLILIVLLYCSIQKVLSSPETIEKSNMYRFMRPWLGDGLITAPSEFD